MVDLLNNKSMILASIKNVIPLKLKVFLRHGYKPFLKDFKLKTVAEKMKIPLDPEKLHDALYDVEITVELFDRINKIRKQIQ